MIRDTLIGIILLACLGLATIALGETGTLVASACCATGFLAREVWDRRRRQLADRRLNDRMNQNRERMGLAPIGRASRPKWAGRTGGAYFPNGEDIPPMPRAPAPPPPSTPLGFPDRPIVPRRDARFDDGDIQPDRPWPR